MTIKRILLGTTALLGAGLIGSVSPLQAAETKAGGKLDVTVSGFARFLAGGGDLEEKFLTRGAGSTDFRNDTEVHIIASILDESTGIKGGARIEFEADTNRNDNTDETYVFLEGAFGEFRLGDEDGVADNMKIGGFTLAVGTGGIDGTVVGLGSVVGPTNSGDATKIVYYSPSLAGFQLGLSYTPHAGGAQGDNFPNVTNNGTFDDFVEAGLAYTGNFGDFGIKASIVGGMAEQNNNGGDIELTTVFGGLQTSIFGITLAAGYGHEELDSAVANESLDRDWFNVGAKVAFGPVGLSVTYGQVVDADVEPSSLVFGAEIGLIPGVVLSGEVEAFDRDVADNDGVVGVVRLAVAF